MSNLIHRDVSRRGFFKKSNVPKPWYVEYELCPVPTTPAVIGEVVTLFNLKETEHFRSFSLSRGWRSHTRQREGFSRCHRHTSLPLAPRHFQSFKEALTAQIFQVQTEEGLNWTLGTWIKNYTFLCPFTAKPTPRNLPLKTCQFSPLFLCNSARKRETRLQALGFKPAQVSLKQPLTAEQMEVPVGQESWDAPGPLALPASAQPPPSPEKRNETFPWRFRCQFAS